MEKDINKPIKSILDRTYNQALNDFAKWVNENQMIEFNIDIMIANKGNANIEDLIKLYLSNLIENDSDNLE